MGIVDAVTEAIRDHGPIAFDEYMDLALYGYGGYYDAPPIGPHGDFVTSPHVHPVFAELLARAIIDLHARLGAPVPLRLAEVGAGDGTLATSLLPHLAPTDPVYVAVERSRGGRAALDRVDGVEVTDRLPEGSDVVVVNELLDNLPFRRFRGTHSGVREVAVARAPERLVEALIDVPPDPGVDIPELAEGEEWLWPTGALGFVDEIAARLARPGYALLIDYGGAGEPGGPVHGYRAQRPVDDVLADPGSLDITAGVDFDLIAARAERDGLVAFPTVSQRDALRTLGFDRWIHEELARQGRLLDDGRGLDAIRTWSGRSRATLLVDPSDLGRLRWLVLATPGLPAPGWL